MADNYMTYDDAVDVLTPYAEKINTIKPEPITWAAYQLLTTAQKEAKRYVITDYPSPTGYVNELADLEDVDINTSILVDGQMLVYDSTTQKWKNKSILENSLTSTATDKALTAAKGKELQDNKQPKELETAITVAGTSKTTVETALDGINDYVDDSVEVLANVCGSKNFAPYPYIITTQVKNGITFTDHGNGPATLSGTAAGDTYFVLTNQYYLDAGTYILSGCPSGGGLSSYILYLDGIAQGIDSGDSATFTLNSSQATQTVIFVKSGTAISTPITFYPMIRDARILDPTFAPYAKTNQQLTADKAERSDISAIRVTGSTNNTGSTINNRTYFYLDGNYCKALADIANGATFTLNTNYKIVTASEEVQALNQKTNFLIQKNFAIESGSFSVDIPLANSCIALVAAMYPAGANTIKSEIYIVSRQGTSILMDKIGGNSTGTTIVVKDNKDSTITIPSNPYGATIGFLQLEG